MSLMVMGIVAGGVFLAYVYGGGWPAPGAIGKEQPTPTRFIPADRGSDTGRTYATPAPIGPLNMATAEAYSLSVYATAVAGSALPDPPQPAPTLPSCDTGRLPCQFVYSAGPPAPAHANLATGGTNTGSEGHPQKDTDQAADPWGGDKP